MAIDAWKFYRDRFTQFIEPIKDKEDSRILKTDCDNEVNFHPDKYGVIGNAKFKGKIFLMDIDPTLVIQAQRMGYNAMKGDIRRIQFPDNYFEMVFDFSTIDHVTPNEVEKVLS